MYEFVCWDRRVALGKLEEPSTTRRSQRSRESRGWYSRGYLPHVDGPGLIQHITFHLADSLPREAVARMEQELVGYPEDQQAAKRRQRIQSLLDSGLGSCIFDRDDHARIVEKSLLFGDGERYRLLAWVIMPNHVHVLIEQKEGWLLAKIVQSWKRHTSREIRRLGLPSCTRRISPLWQRDYWDRFIRNERHFQTAKQYIENNPVVAGLIDSAERWPWGSARFRELPSATRRSQER